MTAPPPVQPPAPLRFADYFFQCGLNPAARLADRRVLDDGSIAGEVAERGRQASEGVSPGNAMPLPQGKLCMCAGLRDETKCKVLMVVF